MSWKWNVTFKKNGKVVKSTVITNKKSVKNVKKLVVEVEGEVEFLNIS